MSFGEAFLQLLIWIPLIMLWGFALVDLFHTSMSGIAKALWALAIVLVPIIGLILYFTFRPEQVDVSSGDVSTEVAQGADSIDSLARLHELNKRGVLDDAEYMEYKAILVR